MKASEAFKKLREIFQKHMKEKGYIFDERTQSLIKKKVNK